MLWVYGPQAISPKTPSSNILTLYYYVAAAVASIIIIGVAVAIIRGRSKKK